MRRLNPTHTYHPAGILFCGLLTAQILATVQVYLSNIDLYKTVSAIYEAGYLAVPNVMVMNRLQNFWPAFWGGLFFTCSIGAGISLGSMAAAWIWCRLFLRNKLVLFVFLSVWGGLLLISNIDGLTIFPTVYFVSITPALFWLTAKWAAPAAIQPRRKLRWLQLAPLPLLALLWFTQFDAELFVDLRDNLLLSNYFGKKFNHFYYNYTLYPAESFKALDQKLIRTCRLDDIANPGLKRQLANRLLANDYIPVPGVSGVDLTIRRAGDHFVFSAGDRKVLQIKADQFMAQPQKTLQKYSAKRDRHGAFRQFTYLSLLIGFPVLIYIILHFIFYYLAALFLGRNSSSISASMLCLLIGLLVLVYFQAHRSRNIQIKSISQALASENLSTRIAALKSIRQNKLAVADYRAYPRLLKSPDPRERYWLVLAMAVNRSHQSFTDLLKFSEDKNINVRCMAFHSLGLHNNRQAIEPILREIKISRDWYAQLYAYKALRSLGWKQKKSP
jgi:hypothetical protein